VKDRKGPVGRAAELAAGVAAAARRSRKEREPKIVVYDHGGHGRALTAADAAYEPLLATGRELIALGPPA
jgi:hypothetical protein